ncbi:MAG: hypothetical protein AAGH89_08015 [Verrucomicrobiota bacterium]
MERSLMTPTLFDQRLLQLLRLGTFLCFAGWTWAHLYWEGPYGVLLWHDDTYELAEKFGISWERFVGTGANDGLVQGWIGAIGWLYLACCIGTLTARGPSRLQLGILIGGCGLLIFLSYAKYVGAARQLPMFVEHGGQMLMPILLVLALTLGVRHRATVITAMVAFIMTFAGHGAYALGYHWPTPANFVGMTSVILGFGPETARLFLLVAGILDLVVCIGIFFPLVRRPCALYAAAWGFATALARPVAGMSFDLNYWGADQYLHEFILRAPHFIIPLFLFFVWRDSQPVGKAAKVVESQVEENEHSTSETF